MAMLAGNTQDEKKDPSELSYASPLSRVENTSTFALVSAFLSMAACPCCATVTIAEVFTPDTVSLVAGNLRMSLIILSAVPASACFCLSCYAAIRIRSSRGKLGGMRWAVTGIVLSLFWILTAVIGLGWFGLIFRG